MTNTLKRMVGMATVLTVITVAVPVAMQGQVSEDNWQPITTSVQSSTGAASTSRMHLPQQLDRMQRIGDTLAAVMYPSGCANVDCAVRDLAVLNGGEMKIVRGIPESALAASRVLASSGRVLWTEREDNSTARFAIKELDMFTATTTTLARNVFMGDASEVRVLAEADKLYFEIHGLNEVATGMPPVTIRQSSSHENVKHTIVMNQQWRKSLERIEDVSTDGVILTRMTFPGGDQELWMHQRNVERGVLPRPQSVAVPGSYTVDGHLVGTHFVDSDTIEFFRYQTLMRYTISTGVLEDVGERLHWVADETTQEDLVVIADTVAYFVGEDESARTTLNVRKDGVTTELGTAAADDLWIDGATVTTVTSKTIQSSAGVVSTPRFLSNYDADAGVITRSFAGAIDLEERDDTRAWIDAAGSVHWSRENSSGQTVATVLGTGSRVYLTGETSVLWTGFDGGIYSATVRPASITQAPMQSFYKLTNSSAVYMVMDGTRWIVPNEETFFTWASSFASVQTVSTSALEGFANGGFLQMKPGMLMKTATSNHVMVVQDNWHKQRIANEEVAYEIFGENWWQHIHIVAPETMNQYAEVPGPIESVDQYFTNLQ